MSSSKLFGPRNIKQAFEDALHDQDFYTIGKLLDEDALIIDPETLKQVNDAFENARFRIHMGYEEKPKEIERIIQNIEKKLRKKASQQDQFPIRDSIAHNPNLVFIDESQVSRFPRKERFTVSNRFNSVPSSMKDYERPSGANRSIVDYMGSEDIDIPKASRVPGWADQNLLVDAYMYPIASIKKRKRDDSDNYVDDGEYIIPEATPFGGKTKKRKTKKRKTKKGKTKKGKTKKGKTKKNKK
jgi:hypothetical protein